MSEPDIYVEWCWKCPAYEPFGPIFRCDFLPKGSGLRKVLKKGRRFPRWCPLLKGPITVAAVKRTTK